MPRPSATAPGPSRPSRAARQPRRQLASRKRLKLRPLDPDRGAPMKGDRPQLTIRKLWRRRHVIIAGVSIAAIAAHVVLRFGWNRQGPMANLPLWMALAVGGAPLVIELTI